MAKITGAQCLADMLQGYGVSHVFMVPAVLRRTFAEIERRTKIKRIHTHGEKSAAYMADGCARASGRPGICMAQVIGALNLAAGLRDAHLAHSPVIAFTGGRDPKTKFRKVYQEVDDVPAFEPVTKFNATVDAVERFPDMVRQAFRVAVSGTPGPVHLQFCGNEGQIDAEEAEMEPLYAKFDAFVTAGLGEAPRLSDYRSVSFWQKPSLLTAWNVTGQPVLALPNGFGRNGLPLGMQILGRPFGEETILRVGHAYEQATEWHARRPALVPGNEAPAVTPPPVLSGTADQVNAETRDLCVKAARRAGLQLDDLMLAQLLEGAPYALAMVKRLRRDHDPHHEPANVFSFPPSGLG